MKLNGKTVAEKINKKAQSFPKVKIYAGDKWHPAAHGKMKNLIVKTIV